MGATVRLPVGIHADVARPAVASLAPDTALEEGGRPASGRNSTWLERFLRAVMIIHLLNGILISFLQWLWAVEKVQQAFSLAVAVEL